MTIGCFTDEPFTDVAQGCRARSVGVIVSSDKMLFIDEVLVLVGRRAKLIVGSSYAKHDRGGTRDAI